MGAGESRGDLLSAVEQTATQAPKQRSERLYNKDLAPESATGSWKARNLFNWWMSGWHSLGGYTMAIGLFMFGITGWQLIFAFVIGVAVLYLVNNLTGVAGQREKVPFPVFARGAFGVFGANIPAIIRAIVAVFWYGIQTYLASAAIMLLLMKVVPATAPLAETSFLGLSALGWICFVALSGLQLLVLMMGMESVRKLSDFAGPTIWVALLALAIWMLARADWSIDLGVSLTDFTPSAGMQIYGILASAFIVVSYFAGPSLNFSDFTRNAPSEKSVRTGNAYGLLLNASAFGIVSVVIALASVEVYGEAIHDPIALLADIDSITLLLVAIIAISISTAGVNIICNYVAPVYDLMNVWPKLFTFRKAGALVGILSIVITPWNLFSNPVIVNQLIGSIGALIGPLFGIIVADYYLIQRRRLATDDLFTEDPRGRYHYRKGYNPQAIWSLAITGLITIIVSFAPVFSSLVPFTWLIGAVFGAVIYTVLSRGSIARGATGATGADGEVEGEGSATTAAGADAEEPALIG